MVYLDYSATTKVDEKVLETFNKVCLDFIGNPNSLHKLGIKTKTLIDEATNQLKDLLNLDKEEIIYTSGASEANNLALKGICDKYPRGKHIITTDFEHSSIYGPLSYLQKKGCDIDIVKTDENGIVDLTNLQELICDDTILVSVAAVNSEIGISQPITEIGQLLKKYPKCFFHTDITQALSKIDVDLSLVDLASFSAHKFFGIKGIGCLIKKNKLMLEPIIHGGKSTTIYRSGTPAAPLIVSCSKALRLAMKDENNRYDYVLELNKYLREKLQKIENIRINSNSYCIPHILNISALGIKPETMLHALEEDDIYISTQTACSSSSQFSRAVLALTKDEVKAKTSLRISISYKTTKEEIDCFIDKFIKNNNKLLELKK